MKKTLLILAACLMGTAVRAQWVKPAYPSAQPLTVGTDCYLLNIDADGFLLGANDWGTRASINPTHGHKVCIEKFANEELDWDGESYFITNDVEQGGMAGKRGNLFIDTGGNIWVDRASSIQPSENQGFTFNITDENIYRIGFARVNQDFSYEMSCMDAYLGIIPEMKDTRLQICYPGSEAYNVANYQIRWIFVSENDYSTYVAARLAYDAAVLLGQEIEAAKTENEGIDISEVEAVYNTLTSTAEQLNQARTRLVELVVEFQTARAGVDTPANYSSFISNAAYESGNNDGWSGTVATVNFGVAEIYSWGANTFDYHQTVKNLPAGIYRVGVTGYYRSGTNQSDYEHFVSEEADSYRHVSLYAQSPILGAQTAPLPLQNSGASDVSLHADTYNNELGYVPNSMAAAAEYFKAEKYTPATVLTMVGEDGQLTIGMNKNNSETDNWAIWDNWTLQYLGQSVEAYQLMTNTVLAAQMDYEQAVNDGDVEFYPNEIYQAYLLAKKKLETSSDVAEISLALSEMVKQYELLDAGVKVYAEFYLQLQEVLQWLADHFVDNEEGLALQEFCEQAIEKLELGTYAVDQMIAEAETLQQLYYDARANSMSDGDDCTSMLANANFSEAGGWTSAVGPVWPADGVHVGQATNMVFDVYQELTGLQNGLYEFTTNDVYRADEASLVTGGEPIRAYIYLNEYKKLMNGLLDGTSETPIGTDEVKLGNGTYAPTSAVGASKYFEAGKYAQTVYGLVTDGTLRIGYRNDLRYSDGSLAWWGGAKLIFRAKNPEALREVVGMSVEDAKEKQKLYIGVTEEGNLSTAIENALEAYDEELFDCLIALREAMAQADDCAVAYEALQVALRQMEYALVTEGLDEPLKQQALDAYDMAYDGYDKRTFTTAQALEAVEELNALVVAIKMDGGKASLTNPKDVSDFIVNNTFDPARGSKENGTIEGWTTSPMNGYKQNSVSYNRANITLYQDLSGLPEGTYKVTVHTYYRAGYWNEEEQRIANGEETHLTTLYAETAAERYSKPVINLTEGATTEIPEGVGTKYYTLSDGRFAPDGTAPTVAYFAAGHYLNELAFYVGEDGKARIGLSKDEILANDYEVVGEWNLIYYGEGNNVDKVNDPNAGKPSVDNPQDVSSIIVNNTFDPARGSKTEGTIEGWTTSAMNGYKENSVSYNRAAIDLYQDLSGLPKGTYKVTVHTYYRAGYWNEEEQRIANGEETHLTTLYAQTTDERFSKPVMNLTEGATTELPEGVAKYYTLSDGRFAPDGTSPTVAYFAAGHYLNELPFFVGEDGKVRIGLKKTEVIANDYEVVGTWSLYYYGENNNVDVLTPINDVEATAPTGRVELYNMNGQRLQQMQRGVNIVRMPDGTVRKVLVK